MACRDINELTPLAQRACRLFMETCRKKKTVLIYLSQKRTAHRNARTNYGSREERSRARLLHGQCIAVIQTVERGI